MTKPKNFVPKSRSPAQQAVLVEKKIQKFKKSHVPGRFFQKKCRI